jgi:hypothetical protein
LRMPGRQVVIRTQCRVCNIQKYMEKKKNTHSIRNLNRRDIHQQNKVHVLGSHILSLKIVTKTPNHILMLFAYGFLGGPPPPPARPGARGLVLFR